ncbi:uncharacterized protein LOC9646273 [Selaginella moellendorffii]|uniref:uncharacterized protein LOC9646273 n=1 Tax=Selaginella moellendorffii TaxID=88036 RepID=UPI000D1C8E4F|nr:uncharacterized protein LOC9646273 [Selaginella moellendorffii]|eukprot:XP_024530425.1 uncharacterized protein LOC9646273 [Selaginella moellendorffii]
MAATTTTGGGTVAAGAGSAAGAAGGSGSIGGGGGSGAGGAGGGAGGDEDLTVKTMRKRYEGLLLVRSKAVKGKGAWYWSHLEPILVHNPDTGTPKAVKLRCGLCNAMFSASNPSRTASEHLKRGTCPNFSGAYRPLGSSPPPPAAGVAAAAAAIATATTPKSSSGRKRAAALSSQNQQQQQQQQSLAIVPAAPPAPGSSVPAGSGAAAAPAALDERLPLHLSGGKEDLGALALLEDNVKRIKSPGLKPGSSGGGLTKEQGEAAIALLADWLYESHATVPLAVVEHPKFRAFLAQIGLQGAASRRLLAGPRLDARFEEVKRQSEARLGDALFFQISTDGWKRRSIFPISPSLALSSPAAMAMAAMAMDPSSSPSSVSDLVYITINLPNGSSLFWRALPIGGSGGAKAVEAILEEAVAALCGGSPERCVGIVADAGKAVNKALREVESRRSWIVSVPCQAQAFASLLRDFAKRSPLFRSVATDCLKLVAFFSGNHPARTLLQRFQRDAYARIRALAELAEAAATAAASASSSSASAADRDAVDPALALLLPDGIAASARALHAIVADASFKMVYAGGDDPAAREASEIVLSQGFWKDLEAVQAISRVVAVMIRDMEAERPLVSQCLPMWEELRDKLMDCCARHGKDQASIMRLIQARFTTNYHPAWSAALVLDPLYLVKDANNRYLPPYKILSSEQEKDVDRLITRLVSREEAHIVLMELMKWRSEGLDPLYAQAVQVKETDPATGRVKCMSGQSRRLVWETCLNEFRLLGKVAARLIFLHATSGGVKSWALKVAGKGGGGFGGGFGGLGRVAAERAGKMMYVAAHAKLERHDFVTDEEREFLAAAVEEEEEMGGGSLARTSSGTNREGGGGGNGGGGGDHHHHHHHQQQQQQQHEGFLGPGGGGGSTHL